MNEIEIDAPKKVPTIQLKRNTMMNEIEIDAPKKVPTIQLILREKR